MGRRKQANPIKVSVNESATLATSSISPSTTSSSSSVSFPSSTPPPKHFPSTNNGLKTSEKPPTKKAKTDFSIKAQLEIPKSNINPFNSTLSPQSLSNALKAYETLINELNRQPNGMKPGPLLKLTKQVDKLASKDGKRDPVTESALDLRVKKTQSSSNTVTNSPSKSTATISKSSKYSDDDTLRKLTSLVGKAGTSMNASMAAVVKSPTNETKDDSDPCKIFTCLQCFERFPGMQELVEHMSKTKHFNQAKPLTNNGFLDPHSLLRQSLISSQKI